MGPKSKSPDNPVKRTRQGAELLTDIPRKQLTPKLAAANAAEHIGGNRRGEPRTASSVQHNAASRSADGHASISPKTPAYSTGLFRH